MSNPKITLDPERKENLFPEKKIYIKPAIGEEATLPSAIANGYLTPIYDDRW